MRFVRLKQSQGSQRQTGCDLDSITGCSSCHRFLQIQREGLHGCWRCLRNNLCGKTKMGTLRSIIFWIFLMYFLFEFYIHR
jgi:hypothetical protein